MRCDLTRTKVKYAGKPGQKKGQGYPLGRLALWLEDGFEVDLDSRDRHKYMPVPNKKKRAEARDRLRKLPQAKALFDLEKENPEHPEVEEPEESY